MDAGSTGPQSHAAVQTQTRASARSMILGTAAIGSLGVFSLHMLLPALPTIREALRTDDGAVQLLISLGMLATALGNLLVAPLSDRYGRRRVILAALTTFVVGSSLAVLAPGIVLLVLARILQTFGAGAAMSVNRAAVTDHFGPGGAAATAMAYSAMTVLVVPMFAPALGGALVEWGHWRTIFFFAVIIGAAVLAFTARRLSETLLPATAPSSRPGTFASYAQLLVNLRYIAHALFGTFMMCTVYTFIAGAPYAVMHVMGTSPTRYGLLSLLPAAASFCGFLVAARLSRRIGALAMMRAGLAGALLAVLLIAALMLAHVWIPLALFAPAMLLAFANATAIPSTMTSAIAVRADIAGAASGMIGFLELGVSALAAQLVAELANGTPYPLVGIMVGTSLLASVCFVVLGRSGGNTEHRTT